MRRDFRFTKLTTFRRIHEHNYLSHLSSHIRWIVNVQFTFGVNYVIFFMNLNHSQNKLNVIETDWKCKNTHFKPSSRRFQLFWPPAFYFWMKKKTKIISFYLWNFFHFDFYFYFVRPTIFNSWNRNFYFNFDIMANNNYVDEV